MNVTEGAVYIDSPIAAAVRQVSPFFKQGVFTDTATPLLMRKRLSTGFGLLAPQSIDGVKLHMIDGKTSKRMPVKPGGAIFYPFNGQGNLHTVANRGYKHVLVLHGESNKRASARPAARLYDYACVAGDIAVDRYLKAGIFRKQDVADGRLIKTGDTFVQALENCIADQDGDHLLYAPTWEGYGGAVNDYSSIDGMGFDAIRCAISESSSKAVLIRPHPYLGLLRPALIKHLVMRSNDLSRSIDVKFDLTNANHLVKLAVRLLVAGNPAISIATGAERVSLCLCDVSAIEAVCLKAELPHFVIRKNCKVSSRVAMHYEVKSAENIQDLHQKLPDYLSNSGKYDLAHRDDAFAVSDNAFLSPDYGIRFAKIMDWVKRDYYWTPC